MWNKIFLVLLAVCVLTMGVLLYLPYSWLGSITDPKIVAVNFGHYAGISRTFLFISSLILLIAGNVLLFKTRRSWGLWTAFFYFAVFMLAQTFWLEQSFFRYQQTNNFTDSVFFFGSFIAVLFVALAAVLVFFNQYLVKQTQAKMFPPSAPVEQIPERISGEKEMP
ncbi:MAG: hypothetical protein M3T96_01580 [Acidobacteriota bacterium]|nr:hypothetical protein [Acidobacteriota bacterium]